MKSVLISIQPKWCELIASGKKTVEVRKTRPKIQTPFKCYIYCTMGGEWLTSVDGVVQKPNEMEIDLRTKEHFISELNGKVIGEFVCDKIMTAPCGMYSLLIHSNTCLSVSELYDYADTRTLYGWHISNLVIYDKPKELFEFFTACNKTVGTDCSKCIEEYSNVCHSITRPPQSWCYVEGENG